MLKKIQKYLLLHYPLLWNIKIIPMGIAVLALNLLFFSFGYISGKINFQETYSNRSNAIFFLIAGFTSVLTVIIWLIFYLKNNALKSFYPKKSISLYCEWILIFILISCNTLYCFSYYQGILVRQRTQISYTELQKNSKLLRQIQVLIPKDDSYYYTRVPKKESSESDLQNTDSISISLLNFNIQNYYSSSRNDTLDYYTVKQWLRENKQDSIKLVMQQYLDLQKKYNLDTNLTADKWFNLIYNYPDFPISSKNYISQIKYPYDNTGYYLQYANLANGYREIDEAFTQSNQYNFILTSLYISLFLSIALFSFRVTSGKSWLISIVVAGLLIFIYGIIIGFYATLYSDKDIITILTVFYWSMLFIVMIIYLSSRIYGRFSKKQSPIMLNLSLWLFSILPLIIYNSLSNNYSASFYWINLIFIIIALFFVMIPIKKIHSLPEE